MSRKLLEFQETSRKPTAEYRNCKHIENGSFEITPHDLTGNDNTLFTSHVFHITNSGSIGGIKSKFIAYHKGKPVYTSAGPK